MLETQYGWRWWSSIGKTLLTLLVQVESGICCDLSTPEVGDNKMGWCHNEPFSERCRLTRYPPLQGDLKTVPMALFPYWRPQDPNGPLNVTRWCPLQGFGVFWERVVVNSWQTMDWVGRIKNDCGIYLSITSLMWFLSNLDCYRGRNLVKTDHSGRPWPVRSFCAVHCTHLGMRECMLLE